MSGANVNGRTPEGRTVLQIAASQGHGKVIDLLLEKGTQHRNTNSDLELIISEK